jgi:hypothetical protein
MDAEPLTSAAVVPTRQAAQDARSAWRTEVGRFRVAQPRRTFPLGVHLGVPAGPRCSLELPWPPDGVDAGLRSDLLGALLTRAEEPAYLWLTRPGVPERHDVDIDWHAAAVRAFGAYGASLRGSFAVTRSGWLDVVNGEARSWKRLRIER